MKVRAPYLTLPCLCLFFCIFLCCRVKVNTHLLNNWKTLSLLPFLLKVTLLNVIWNWEHFKLEKDDHCNKDFLAPVHPCSTIVTWQSIVFLHLSALKFSTSIIYHSILFYIKRNPHISELFFQDQTSTLWHRLMMQYMMAWGQWKMLLKMVRSLIDNNWLLPRGGTLEK